MFVFQEADISVGDIGVTYERAKMVNYLTPILTTDHKFLLKQRKGSVFSEELWIYANPMENNVWFAFAGTLFVLGFLWTVFSALKRRLEGSLHWKGLLSDLFTYSHLFLRQSK